MYAFVKIPLKTSLFWGREHIWGVRKLIISSNREVLVVTPNGSKISLGMVKDFTRQSLSRAVVMVILSILALYFISTSLGEMVINHNWGGIVITFIPALAMLIVCWFYITMLLNGCFKNEKSNYEIVPMSKEFSLIVASNIENPGDGEGQDGARKDVREVSEHEGTVSKSEQVAGKGE